MAARGFQFKKRPLISSEDPEFHGKGKKKPRILCPVWTSVHKTGVQMLLHSGARAWSPGRGATARRMRALRDRTRSPGRGVMARRIRARSTIGPGHRVEEHCEEEPHCMATRSRSNGEEDPRALHDRTWSPGRGARRGRYRPFFSPFRRCINSRFGGMMPKENSPISRSGSLHRSR